MEWTKKSARRDAPGRKVALVEQVAPVSAEEPQPEEDGRRRANRRLKLLAGLLSRGKGDVID